MVARDFPGSRQAVFADVSGSSSASAVSITCAASFPAPRSRRAAPRARVLFPRPPAPLSSGPVPRRASRSPSGASRSRHWITGGPSGRLIRKCLQCPLIAGFAPVLDMRVVQALAAQQRSALARVLQLLVLLEDRQLVVRGEGPPLRLAGPSARARRLSTRPGGPAGGLDAGP